MAFVCLCSRDRRLFPCHRAHAHSRSITKRQHARAAAICSPKVWPQPENCIAFTRTMVASRSTSRQRKARTFLTYSVPGGASRAAESISLRALRVAPPRTLGRPVRLRRLHGPALPRGHAARSRQPLDARLRARRRRVVRRDGPEPPHGAPLRRRGQLGPRGALRRRGAELPALRLDSVLIVVR